MITTHAPSQPPAFQAKPVRQKPVRREDKFHETVATLFSQIIARPGVCSGDGVLWYSVEGRAKRSIFEGARNKRRGCIAGVSDIFLAHRGQAYMIELKATSGTLSPAQRDLHDELRRADVRVATCMSVESVMDHLRTWRIPHRAVSL